jgi:acyl-CoA dehydrogenase
VPDRSFLDWPFLDARHRALAEEADAFGRSLGELAHAEEDVDAACRELVARLGASGLLGHVVPGAYRGQLATPGLANWPQDGPLDVRSLCIVRETLAYHGGLADFAFAMQGLGSAPVTLFGTDAQRAALLPEVAAGRAITAFALSEPEAGSDVAALATTAQRDGEAYVIDGVKTWISNGGIADRYVVFARTGEAPGARGLSAFLVDRDAPGLSIQDRLHVMSPHPLATLGFDGVRVGGDRLIGEPGRGFQAAMGTLDVFRSTVAAAALGMARRALDETAGHARRRELFGAPLADLQLVQGKLADMALQVDAAALLVYRAAWTKDQGASRVTREAAMAKLYATEAAQRVVDDAVQLHGGLGVTRGHPVERLYREVRALRIYEGASEVQQVVIARQLLAAHSREESR